MASWAARASSGRSALSSTGWPSSRRTTLWDPNITWTEGEHNTLTGTRKGTDEVLTLLGHVARVTGGTFALDIEQIIADDTRAVVICNTTGTRDGSSYAFRSAHLWTIESGKLTSFEEFNTDGQASDQLFA